MSDDTVKFQRVVYRVFLVSCGMATVLGLVLIWGGVSERDSGVFLMRALGTCVVIAVASALTVSTTRLANARRPDDGDA